MKTVYLALGTNLGDRAANLRMAVKRIGEAGVRVTKLSSVYETKPMYRTAQPLFLNMVVEGKTDVLPQVLLKRLLGIELEMGRRRTIENGPRVIDIDILFYGRNIIDAAELTVPHPRMGERRFVMEPLAEVAPGWRHPLTKKKTREMLAELPEQGVTLWSEWVGNEPT